MQQLLPGTQVVEGALLEGKHSAQKRPHTVLLVHKAVFNLLALAQQLHLYYWMAFTACSEIISLLPGGIGYRALRLYQLKYFCRVTGNPVRAQTT